MEDRIGEPVGFLCRWSLLALVGAIVLAAVSAMLTTAGAAIRNVSPNMAVGDVVCEESRKRDVVVVGIPLPAMETAAPAMVLGSVSGGPLMLSVGYGGYIVMRLPRPKTGRYQLRLIGVPYGPMAFYSDDVLVRVLPADEKVFLVDDRLALSIGPNQRSAWRQAVALMRRYGEFAVFHSGSASQLAAVRDRIRRAYHQAPVLFDDAGKGDSLRTLFRTSWALNPRRRRGKRRPRVITADADLARRAAAKGFGVYLVSPSPAAAMRRVTVFASFGALRDRLVAVGSDSRGER